MNPTPTPTATPPLQTKFDKLEGIVQGKLFERRKHIETAILALIARSHHCQYGPPGVGKTYMVDELTNLIDGALPFRWLMTRFTTPDEIFGPISVKGLENDKFVRNLAGKMVPSNITFLDEAFKANSAILNALLTIMNEGLFFNGADIIKTRPIIFMGSNELPREAELMALWDRVTLRVETTQIVERGNMMAMLKSVATRTTRNVHFDPVLTWDEIVQAQDEADKVDVSDDVLDQLIKLQGTLRSEGVEPSDRRIAACIPIIRATAWREGRTYAEVEDMRHLKHVLWLDPSQISIVEKAVLELANPLEREALTLIEDVDRLSAEVKKILDDSDNDQARRRKGIEINAKLTRVSDQLDELMIKVSKSPNRSDMVEEARNRLSGVVQSLLHELFGIDPKGIGNTP